MEELFTALGHPLRLAIVQRLLRDGPATVNELESEGIGKRSATSDAVTTLIAAGILRRDAPRDGKCHVVWGALSANLLVAGGRLSSQISAARADSQVEELESWESLAEQLLSHGDDDGGEDGRGDDGHAEDAGAR
jgi:hypothetical protein